jgi:hypothetical protein
LARFILRLPLSKWNLEQYARLDACRAGDAIHSVMPLRATTTTRRMRRAAPQMITATVSIVEIGSMPTYHAEQGKHIGENGDRGTGAAD